MPSFVPTENLRRSLSNRSDEHVGVLRRSVSPELAEEPSSSPIAEAPANEQSAPVLGLGMLIRTGRIFDYFVLMGSIGLCWFGVTVQQPYLNPWAQEHGMQPAQAGAIFAVQPFAVVFINFFIPALAKRLGEGKLMLIGLFLSVVALALFATIPAPLLRYGPTVVFSALMVAGIVAGLGEGMVETCVYSLCQETFPECVGQVVGHAEAWAGIGSALGPALGGVLYETGGFAVPPATSSALLFFFGVLAIVWLRKRSRKVNIAGEGQAALTAASSSANEIASTIAGIKEDEDMGPHRRDPIVFVCALVGVMIAGFVQGVGAPLASDYWSKTYGMSGSQVGYIFGVYGFAYLVLAIITGIVNDKGIKYSRAIFPVGAYIAAVGLVFFGWKSLPLSVSIAGILVCGAAQACLMVPGLSVMNQSTPVRDTNFTSAFLNGGYAFGLGVGPLIAVPLSSAVGIQATTTSFAIFAGTFGVISTLALLMRPLPQSSARNVESTDSLPAVQKSSAGLSLQGRPDASAAGP